jgi:hypothetical protein
MHGALFRLETSGQEGEDKAVQIMDVNKPWPRERAYASSARHSPDNKEGAVNPRLDGCDASGDVQPQEEGEGERDGRRERQAGGRGTKGAGGAG